MDKTKHKHIEVWQGSRDDLKAIAKLEGVSMKKLIDMWIQDYKKTAVLRR